MHLSLKGSMDRQPLTDRLGDRLLAEYGGAAAAYSLRALNGNGDSVVRVRRASDNDEKDFTAEQIELGEMVNWVNSQTVPPLDIGVETSEGRIPVPEGGTSIGTPAAAYSLRNLSTTYTGNVVDVRRSSDNAVRSFTAAEVADGTLTTWVNANEVHYSTTFASDLGGWDLETSGWTGTASWTHNAANDARLAVTATGVSSGARRPALTLTRPSNILVGENYSTEIDYEVISGTVVFLDDNIGGVPNYLNPVTLTGSGTMTIDAQPFNPAFAFFYFDGDNHTFELSIKGIRFKSTAANGTVSKWYDQSGNNNHAVQTTAASQPKIVDAGSLVSYGLDFNGGVKNLTFTPFSATNETIFVQSSTLLINAFSTVLSGADNRAVISQNSSSVSYNVAAGGFASISAESASGKQLFTFNRDGTNVNAYQNGTLLGSNTTYASESIQRSVIGTRGDTEGDYNGSIQEIIFYSSDQSANRRAIEANIGETYGISGIPAYDNTVDGFVETWYDQSGNGNDATQSVAASQPKIVSAGALVTDENGSTTMRFTHDNTNRVFLEFDPFYSNDDDISAFVVTERETNNDWNLLIGYDNNNQALDGGFSMSDNGTTRLPRTSVGDISINSSIVQDDIVNLRTAFWDNSSLSIATFVNGADQQTGTATQGSVAPPDKNRIGDTFIVGVSGDVKITEVILYNSDQSANRPAIEANINNQYNIF